MEAHVFEDLFSAHRSADIPSLWPWQGEVLSAFAGTTGDAAVELPTGTGKTLVALLAGEQFRASQGKPVAYLAGNKQLAQQIERHARDLGFPVVRFQGKKDTWQQKDVRAFNFGQAIGVMNYWNYFNSNPGVEPAGMLILDDVHLLEGPIRDMFTVALPRTDPLYKEILGRIYARYPYYSLAEDLLNDVEPDRPPDMLAPYDSVELAGEVRDLLDAHLDEESAARWSWQRIRDRIETCCWLVSSRAVAITPYIPPTQTLQHFFEPERRLYLSATIGSADDLQRRLGLPPMTKLTASVQPRQGKRLVVIRDGLDSPKPAALIEELSRFLQLHPKALWLCARREAARALETALLLSGLPGGVRRLEGDNAADEPFAADTEGHLITAGRYDGMDFPGEACRVEIVPEVPVATSDLEEFVSSYLRDAPFAVARLAQRVAQALGRCNRAVDDRAVYLLTDPEFLGRFNQKRTVDALPADVRGDVYSALERSDKGFESGLADAERFLVGEDFESGTPPALATSPSPPNTAADEVEGLLALWRQDYSRAADLFDRVQIAITEAREHRAFWLSMRAMALYLASRFGDAAAAKDAKAALRAAASTGASSTFFTRLRLSQARVDGSGASLVIEGLDDVYAAWDRVIDRYGTNGPRFDKWCGQLLEDLAGSDHDAVARAIATVGGELLGLRSEARKPTSGQEDAYWILPSPRRTLAFEVKLAPVAQRVTNEDVEQAEGATRAIERESKCPARGILITPHSSVDTTAEARLELTRVLNQDVFVKEVERLIQLVREYRRGWSSDAKTRETRRNSVTPDMIEVGWLWRALEGTKVWIGQPDLELARRLPSPTQ